MHTPTYTYIYIKKYYNTMIFFLRGVARRRGDTRKPLLTVTNEHHNNKALKSSSVE